MPSLKVQAKLDMGHLTHDQLEKTLIKGTQAKSEPDEKTAGKQQKITLHWKKWYLVVKDTDPCLIITAGERD